MTKKNTALSIEAEANRNLVVLWFGVFMAGMGFSAFMPFLPLYIEQLGHFDTATLNILSSVTFAISFIMTALVSPYWGKLADKYGRKPMLIRAALGMAIVISLMACVTNVWQLIVLRALQGLFGGFISNATALIATQTPKAKAGRALGIIVTGTTSGQLIGPLLGGIISSMFSYRGTFLITGFFLFVVTILVIFAVTENHKPTELVSNDKQVASHSFKDLPNKNLLIGMFITTMVIQIVNTSINPIMALFVREINHTSWNTTLLVGIIAALPGISTIIAAPRFGKIGDKIGPQYVLIGGFILAFIVQIPTAFVSSIFVLMLLRFMIGISDAAMLPQINSLMTKSSPSEMTSRIFAYNQSFMSLGGVFGPLIGAYVANTWGYRAIFITGALFIVANFLHFLTTAKQIKKK
ncbi:MULTISPECIES: MFS transporter [unclassified Lactococcus]|uniref:MFS transporter n=1 Tax=unclassified Lactococcus TaxID=2643510 RepID=UPI0011CB9DA3|nr:MULTISPECIES: MFS transporter [unclassified Lactococcus]MQW22097.1 MFS transporter [Lactococcus sp. dk101]TXK45038.1 multidrug efflux MFS transporter [Lactococcus sp. dk310]TXK51182.1 multidrug efflux MFS transporter [Lactococcus sp. dk322]